MLSQSAGLRGHLSREKSMPQDVMPTTSLPPPLETDSVPRVLPQPFTAFDRDRILDLIARQPLFAGLNAEQHKVIRSLAMEVHYDPDELIFREGDPANRFFIILKGYVSLEVRCSEGTIPIRTLGPGDDLGWAWLFPPYFMHFGARTIGPVCALFFYGTRLREVCEEDHELGYALMKRVADILVQNLNATRKLASQITREDYE
jgi:CRP-like cAMP-binding protein